MIAVRDFWNRIAGVRFRLQPVAGLDDRLALASELDQLFGGLARHRVEYLPGGGYRVTCLGCRHAEGSAGDVCESHIGILTGQLRSWNACPLIGHRITDGTVCELIFEAPGAEHAG